MRFSNHFSIITLILTTVFMTGCYSNNSLVPRDEYDNLNGYYKETVGQKFYYEKIREFMKTKNEDDTAFLGFLFNVSKKQNENLINSKIRNQIISEWKDDSSHLYIWNGTYERRVKFAKRGYAYSFHIREDKYVSGVLNFHYDNDSLTAIRYEIYDSPGLNTFRKFLEIKFGKPIIDTSFSENLNTINIICWLNNSKEIQLVSQNNPSRMWLQYNSIEKTFGREEDYFNEIRYKKESDSLNKEIGKKRSLEIKRQADTILKVF